MGFEVLWEGDEDGDRDGDGDGNEDKMGGGEIWSFGVLGGGWGGIGLELGRVFGGGGGEGSEDEF